MKQAFLYEQLTKALLAELASGLYAAGQRFLSKRKITQRWRVSDPTTKSALRCLGQQELIESRPRSGWYVRPGSQQRALLLLHRVRVPKLPPQPGWESKRFALRRTLEAPPCERKVAVISTALPGAPASTHRLAQVSLLRHFDCADAIFEVAQRAGVALEFFVDNGQAERRRLIARQIAELKPSGVIAFRRLLSNAPLQPMLAPVVAAHLPVVTVFDDCEGLNVHSINLNNVAIGYEVARRVLKCRHRRLAVLIPAVRGDYFADRAVGCEQACREAGLPAPDLRVLRLPVNCSNRARLQKLLANTDRPTAIFCTTTVLLAELWQTLTKLRLSVPQDLSLIVTGGTKHIPETPRAVDMVRIDFPAIGRLAFETLLAILAGKIVDRSTFVSTVYSSEGTLSEPGTIVRG